MNFKFWVLKLVGKLSFVKTTGNIDTVTLTITTDGIGMYHQSDGKSRREFLKLTNDETVNDEWDRHLPVFPLLEKAEKAWRGYHAMNTAARPPTHGPWKIGDVVTSPGSMQLWVITRILFDSNPDESRVFEITGYDNHEVKYKDSSVLIRQYMGQVLATVYIDNELTWFRFWEGYGFRLVTKFHDFEGCEIGGWLGEIYRESRLIGLKLAQHDSP